MMWLGYLAIFILSNIALYAASERLVRELTRISRLIRAREFVLAFFVMAAAASLPNLLVGLNAVAQNSPGLSLGDILGNNLVAITLAVAVATLVAPAGVLPAGGKLVQTSALFTAVAGVLPLLLLLDHSLSRGDGIILLGLFFLYCRWIARTRRHQTEVFAEQIPQSNKLGVKISVLLRSFALVVLSIAVLAAATYGIVTAAIFFASSLGISLVIVGIIVTGLGNALPEVYFSAISAKYNETKLIIGHLMGSVLIPATLVLGTVAIIRPITVDPLDPVISGRLLLIAATIFFYIFARSKRNITRSEGFILLGVYLLFVAHTIYQTLNG